MKVIEFDIEYIYIHSFEMCLSIGKGRKGKESEQGNSGIWNFSNVY